MAAEPLVVELTPPPDPGAVAQRFAEAQGFIFFDSAGGPAELARYSYLSFVPFRFLKRRYGSPIDALATELRLWRLDHVAGLPPFQGGAAGLFGYDLCQSLERLPQRRYYGLDLY